MENQKNTSTDEIDLSQLLSKIGAFFTSIGNGSIRVLASIRNTPLKHWSLFLALTIMGGLVAFSYSSFLKKKFYESTMILSSDYLNKRIVDNSIDKLNLLAEEESPKGLAKVLNISDSLAKNIVRFDAKPFVSETDLIELEILKEQLKNAQVNAKNEKVIQQVVDRIEIENRHAFEITVRTFSPAAIKPLQEALVNYFRNNDYIKKRIEITQINLKARRLKLVHESQKLDSLKKVIYSNYRTMAEQSRQGSNNVILSDKSVTNPVDIYNQDMQLNNELQSVDKKLYLQQDFEIVDGFTEFSEPTSASRSKVIAIGLLIGFLFGYVVVAVSKFNQYLSKIE
jgi:uncharacterized membrane-anchored protein YhcB (DUF1043 family)